MVYHELSDYSVEHKRDNGVVISRILLNEIPVRKVVSTYEHMKECEYYWKCHFLDRMGNLLKNEGSLKKVPEDVRYSLKEVESHRIMIPEVHDVTVQIVLKALSGK